MFSLDWLCCLDATKRRKKKVFLVCSWTENTVAGAMVVVIDAGATQILTNQTAYHVALAEETHKINARPSRKPADAVRTHGDCCGGCV